MFQQGVGQPTPPFFNPLKSFKMAKTINLDIDQLIQLLETEKAKGETSVTLYGYIADKTNDRNIIVSDKGAFEEPSFAEWQIARNGY